MPRGVYDRTLTKEQRAAMKAGKDKKVAKSAAPKRKYTRRVNANSALEAPVKSAAKSVTSTSDGVFFMMGEIRHNLAALAQVRSAFGEVPSLAEEAQAQISVLSQLRDKLIEVESANQADNTESVDDNAQNGVTSGQTSVPLIPPPQIVTALPTPH